MVLIHLVLALFISSAAVHSEAPNGELIWSEEFNYEGLPDSSNWSYAKGNGCPNLCGWGNNEIQYYTVRDERNARVEDGRLIIEAIKGEDGVWTSARLKSQHKKTFRYGKIQFRAKLPAGAGTWPALWLLARDIESDGWPECGEIDVMEHAGKKPGQVQSALHTTSSHGDTHNKASTFIEDFHSEFHLYEAHWTPGSITFSVDGQAFYTYAPEPQTEATWPFRDEFFIIMNIAMGGNFGSDAQYESEGKKNGIAPDLEHTRMEVDYVRVYKD